MNDFMSFPASSRIWIYASDRKIEDSESTEINQSLKQFAGEWMSHQKSLHANAVLLRNYFIVIVVDDGFNNPGGCSIDSSVHFIQSLGKKYGIDFFNRNLFHYLKEDQVVTISQAELSDAFTKGIISDSTIFFDNLVQTKFDFESKWLKPLSSSWHRRFVRQSIAK